MIFELQTGFKNCENLVMTFWLWLKNSAHKLILVFKFVINAKLSIGIDGLFCYAKKSVHFWLLWDFLNFKANSTPVDAAQKIRKKSGLIVLGSLDTLPTKKRFPI